MEHVVSLLNKTILVTRPREQSAEVVAEIEKRGGRPLVIPMIRILEPESWEDCDRAIDQISSYDGIVFASANCVTKFLERCEAKGMKPSAFSDTALFAVGEKTRREIERNGLSVDLIPDRFTAEALAARIVSSGIQGKRFLCPRGNLGRDEVVDALREHGAVVDTVTVYTIAGLEESAAAEIAEELESGNIDVVTLFSPSAATQFARTTSPATLARHEVRIAVIGSTTERAVAELGFPAHIVAATSTAEGLLDAIEKYFE